jgi:hypothetical protein
MAVAAPLACSPTLLHATRYIRHSIQVEAGLPQQHRLLQGSIRNSTEETTIV